MDINSRTGAGKNKNRQSSSQDHKNIHQSNSKRVTHKHHLKQTLTASQWLEKTSSRDERKYQILTQVAPVGIFHTDAGGSTTYVNPRWCQIARMDLAEALGNGWLEAVHPEDRILLAEGWQNATETKHNSYAEYRFLHRDGSVSWVMGQAVAERDHTGKITGYIGTITDITERKRAEEEIYRLNAELEQRVQKRTAELIDLYNNAPCGYHSVDKDGYYVRVNDTELSWLGYERDQLLGKLKLSDLLTPQYAANFERTFSLFKEQGQVNDLELEMVRRDGSIFPALLSATAIRDAGGAFLMSRSTIVDNTNRKLGEKAMIEAQEKLKAANRQLEYANKELEAFSFSVSHDLRAPLRTIMGFSEIIESDYANELKPEAKKLFTSICNSAKKMEQLIVDLLAFSRVGRAEMTRSHINMGALAQLVYDELISAEAKATFEFLIADLPDASGDPALIRQVWINLISNAIKYTLPAEEHRIQIGSYVEEGMNVYYVRDSGVGFNPDYTYKLFGVFQRLHQSSEFEGSGVGLVIVQHIVQRHGGSVWAEGKINQGSTFYFSLPQ
jgi:PAS domain S-box-containing protein